MNTNTFIYPQSFRGWVWNSDKQLLWLVAAITLIAFMLFKLLYPYPEFSVDSELYVQAAATRSSVHIFPIGYSIFLRLIGSVSHSHLLLAFIQYISLQFATVCLTFTICYLLKLDSLLRLFSFTTLIFVPLYLYISNFVTNSSLFTTFTLFWISSLLWMLYRPTKSLLLSHGILLTFLLALHNSAIYFPFISLLVIFLSSTRWPVVLLILLLPAAFISFTQYQYHKRTGIVTYSPLIGWELLGTALTAYIKIPKEKRIHEDISYRLLEETNNRFIDSIQHSSTLPDITLRQYYIWNQNSPLYTFIGQKSDPLKSWAQFGKFYNEYALLLIKRYPGPYLQYFVLPNLRHYYTPKISLPAMYNTFLTGRRSHLYSWFQLKESDLTFHKSLDLLAGYYTILFSMLNLFFAFSMIVLGLSRKMHEEWNYLQKSFGLLIAILTSNFLFYVLTKPVEIGYQVAYMVTIFIFSTLAVQMVTKRSVKQEMIAINYDNK